MSERRYEEGSLVVYREGPGISLAIIPFSHHADNDRVMVQPARDPFLAWVEVRTDDIVRVIE